jgi:hypothetical protein
LLDVAKDEDGESQGIIRKKAGDLYQFLDPWSPSLECAGPAALLLSSLLVVATKFTVTHFHSSSQKFRGKESGTGLPHSKDGPLVVATEFTVSHFLSCSQKFRG